MTAPRSRPWPTGLAGLGYGGDYNPEQWPLAIQLEDAPLMTTAGVNILSVGIFSWAMLEPREGEYDFAWLDAVLDRLHAAGIRVAPATATASPPAWLTRRHPEILPVLADGTVLSPGARQAYCQSSKSRARMSAPLCTRRGPDPALSAVQPLTSDFALWDRRRPSATHLGRARQYGPTPTFAHASTGHPDVRTPLHSRPNPQVAVQSTSDIDSHDHHDG